MKKIMQSVLVGMGLFSGGSTFSDAAHQELLVINVLPQKYYEDCHIPGSLSVPITQLADKCHEWSRETHIVVYCAHAECSNGPEAWKILRKQGFKRVSDYAGGAAAWYQAGLPVVGPCQEEYLKGVYTHQEDWGPITIIETQSLYELMKKHGLL